MVPVTAQDDDAVGPGITDQAEQSLPFQGRVRPLFVAMLVGDDLDAGDQEPQLGGLLEFAGEPSPLCLAKQVRTCTQQDDCVQTVRHSFVTATPVGYPQFSNFFVAKMGVFQRRFDTWTVCLAFYIKS